MEAKAAFLKIPTIFALPNPEPRAHKRPCKHCPSAHSPPDPEAADILAQPHAVRVDHAFICAWGNSRFCKGYRDAAGISDADLAANAARYQ